MELVRNTPFTVQVEHDGVDTAEYVLSVNGVEHSRKPFNPAGVNFPSPEGVAPGTYVLSVTAVGPQGSTTFEPVTLVVTPSVPAQGRIVIVVG